MVTFCSEPFRKSVGTLRTCPELSKTADIFEFSVFEFGRILPFPLAALFKTHEIGFKWSDFKV